MTPNGWKRLKEGDVVEHLGSRQAYIIAGRTREGWMLVRTIHAMNPREWRKVTQKELKALTRARSSRSG